MQNKIKKLNIAVLVRHFIQTGGSERYAVEVTRRMVDRGHTVELYARTAEPELLDGIIFHKVPERYGFSSVMSSMAFASDTARMLDGHHHDVVLPMNGAGARISLRCIPLLIRVE